MHNHLLLKQEMEAKGVSISALARRSGLTRPTIQRAVRGNKPITLETLAKIADVLERDPGFFLDLKSTIFDNTASEAPTNVPA